MCFLQPQCGLIAKIITNCDASVEHSSKNMQKLWRSVCYWISYVHRHIDLTYNTYFHWWNHLLGSKRKNLEMPPSVRERTLTLHSRCQICDLGWVQIWLPYDFKEAWTETYHLTFFH